MNHTSALRSFVGQGTAVRFGIAPPKGCTGVARSAEFVMHDCLILIPDAGSVKVPASRATVNPKLGARSRLRFFTSVHILKSVACPIVSGSGLPSPVQALTYWKAVWPIAGVPVQAIAITKATMLLKNDFIAPTAYVPKAVDFAFSESLIG